PLLDFDFRAVDKPPNLFDRPQQMLGVRLRDLEHAIRGPSVRNVEVTRMSTCTDQHRSDVRIMAAFMEVVEVWRIIDHRIRIPPVERGLADRELEDEDD